MKSALTWTLGTVVFLALLPTLSLYFEPKLDIVALFIWVSPTGFGGADALATMWVFAPTYVVGQLLGMVLARGETFSRRAALSLYGWAAVWGTGTSAIFALTNIPFEANFFAWVFVVGLALTIVQLGVGLVRETEPASSVIGTLTALFSSLGRPIVILCILLAISPGLLLVAYKSDPSVANILNLVRRTVSGFGTEVSYTTTNAFTQNVAFRQPVYVEFPAGDPGHAYVLERKGILWRVSWPDGATKSKLFSLVEDNIPDDFENGSLGFALHPKFGDSAHPASGFVYVYFTEADGDDTYIVLARFDLRESSPEGVYASRYDLIRQKHEAGNGFHNGGSVLFGPDGFLYLAIGDLSNGGLIQRLNMALVGGVIRLDVDSSGGERSHPPRFRRAGTVTQGYFVPSDNPLAARDDVFGEYWAWGLRNPYRMQFDPESGALWVGEVGGARIEEVNILERGGNYQWPYREGLLPRGKTPNVIIGQEHKPVHHYRHTALDRAVIGGFVYRGRTVTEASGKYVYADNGSGRIVALDTSQEPPVEVDLAKVGQLGQLGISSVQAAPNGDILVITLGSKSSATGNILRVVPSDGITAPGSSAEGEVATLESVTERYRSECSRCHGLDGRGDDKLGAQLGVKLPDFTTKAWQGARSDAHIDKVIRGGGQAVGISPLMPAWAGALSDDEIKIMVKVVRSFQTP